METPEAYSEQCQTSKMELFVKQLTNLDVVSTWPKLNVLQTFSLDHVSIKEKYGWNDNM